MYSSVTIDTYFININLEEEKNFLFKLKLQKIFQFPGEMKPRLFDIIHLIRGRERHDRTGNSSMIAG